MENVKTFKYVNSVYEVDLFRDKGQIKKNISLLFMYAMKPSHHGKKSWL